MTQEQKKYTFHIAGLRCTSCVAFTDEKIGEHPEVLQVMTDIQAKTVTVTGTFGNKNPKKIAQELTDLLAKNGYVLSIKKQKETIEWKEFALAIPFAAAFLVLFVLLQKIGIINMINTTNVTYTTSFLIGIIASLSTCMAVVGGLVLSMSATFAKSGDKLKPQVLFHAGRIISFFVLGGIIGSVGSMFQLGQMGIFVMNMSVGIVMLILGINLLDILHITKRLQFTMPKVFSKKVQLVASANHMLTPALVGMATFFLPCGFTQSMQLYSLTTGSFIQGGLTMFSFALGTFPVLALMSFSSLSFQKKSTSGVFFKVAGLIVILFAIFNMLNGFVGIGLLQPIFNL